MSKAVITSYTLLDFLSEGDMLAFFTFVEEYMEGHAANLRAHGMTKFYVTRVFNKNDKFTVGNWLEYKDAESYKACEAIWVKFFTDKASKSGIIGKIAPHRCVVQYDYS